MQIEPYYSIQGDGQFITINGCFTPAELRDILDEAEEEREFQDMANRTAAEAAREAEIDDDDLLA